MGDGDSNDESFSGEPPLGNAVQSTQLQAVIQSSKLEVRLIDDVFQRLELETDNILGPNKKLTLFSSMIFSTLLSFIC